MCFSLAEAKRWYWKLPGNLSKNEQLGQLVQSPRVDNMDNLSPKAGAYD